ncbi:glycosyl transferase family 2 [Kineococcus radiotolerans SRS30216 = ATCC BAA-149]|uniref:Glycosyl transferase family 2 n=1 Tax=Kineococcus radiotolerans (strain ATCC BAA-149 / DSM 14245 / SRS30216) TaxID=266940 RepID=A6WE94_KINRD|nr:glycosyl transferase family 2 [Kineococcus radiotolerans SRS30216 = ATCC BAA-149]
MVPVLPRVSVVICTYNRSALVREVVESALADPTTHEVVVADDGSSDDTVEVLQGLAESESRLVVVPLGSNQGRNVARQRGVETATGEIVLLLDDDVVPGPDIARKHAEHHVRERDAVVVGFMPVRTTEATNITSRIYAQEYLGRIAKYEQDSANVLENLWGGHCSLPRAAALATSVNATGFENYYHQDRDFGLRCRANGMHGVFDRHLVSEHRHTRSLDAFLKDANRRGKGLSLLRDRHGEIAMDPAPPIALLGRPQVLPLARTATAPLRRLGGRPLVLSVKLLRRLATWQGAEEYRRSIAG